MVMTSTGISGFAMLYDVTEAERLAEGKAPGDREVDQPQWGRADR